MRFFTGKQRKDLRQGFWEAYRSWDVSDQRNPVNYRPHHPGKRDLPAGSQVRNSCSCGKVPVFITGNSVRCSGGPEISGNTAGGSGYVFTIFRANGTTAKKILSCYIFATASPCGSGFFS